MPRQMCSRLGLQAMYDSIGDTRGMIYPASGPRRENPTCCLSDLVFMMMYMGAVRALVEREICLDLCVGSWVVCWMISREVPLPCFI